MSAWEGVDLAVVREALAGRRGTGTVRLELGTNMFGGQSLVHVTLVDPANPRRKAQPLLPGPIVGDNHADLLRALADVIDGTIGSLVATDPNDDA